MKLASAFIKLPMQFDADRLAEEAAQFTERDWADHPTGFKGNGAVRLISANGSENDEMGGPMRPTAHLEKCPYIQQVLASFQSVFGRSRLMGLGPHSEVPAHSDLNHHWHYRVRIHIPIFTWPEVSFHCDDKAVHMGRGEAWIFDNWRRHWVVNPTDKLRIHLVADTSGSPEFWHRVKRGFDPFAASAREAAPDFIAYRPGANTLLRTENFNIARVMPPGELDALVSDLMQDVRAGHDNDRLALATFCNACEEFALAWRENWYLHADNETGWPRYQALRQQVTAIARGSLLKLGSNGAPVGSSMMGRVVLPSLAMPLDVMNVPGAHGVSVSTNAAPALILAPEVETLSIANRGPALISPPIQKFDRPIIILTAPRSGSTLLFETLAQSEALFTIGGESHGIIEALPELNPASGRIDSNRLTAKHARDDILASLRAGFMPYLRDRGGHPPHTASKLRILEKTPKNALRIPFLEKLFPDARYVFLYRDPREAISSIMESWRNGGWVTYPKLPGWAGPWSFLLPPDWQTLNDKPLAEIAAFQWMSANQHIMDDLLAIDSSRWMTLDYADFLADPKLWTSRICSFADIAFDDALKVRTARDLPHSRLTLTPPKADKWRKNATEIDPLLHRVMPMLETIRIFAANQVVRHPWAALANTKSASTNNTNTNNANTNNTNNTNKKAAIMAPDSRNDLCPCGSTLRYKHCHGKIT